MGSYEDRVNREIEKAESKPKRWLPEGDMEEARVGPYVRFSDYEELEKEVGRLKAALSQTDRERALLAAQVETDHEA